MATLFGALGLLFLGQSSAEAHGVAMVPGSRTYLCYKDGISGSGNGALNPTNPACQDALAQSGGTPLYNWFAVLDSNAGGKGEGYVPDGKICSAGDKSPYDFSAYNAARDDWPKTHLTSGATMQVEYSNWAAHPGDFRVYVTKNGWSSTTPLAWSDMDLVQTVTNPPAEGSAGQDGGHYYWNLDLPSGHSGDAMIFIQWVRSDSNENFFSCSDVIFDGGNGEVTGIGDSAPTDPGDGGSTGGSTGGDTGEDPGACMAGYATVGEWSGGFQGEVTVMNHDTEPLNGWTVSWKPGAGTTLTSIWNGTMTTASDGTVTVRNSSSNGTVAADGETTFGFTATSDGVNFPNGPVSCTSP